MEDILTRLQGDDPGPALSELTALCKKSAPRREIDEALSERDRVYALLEADKPKVRKNAARLLGALESPRDAEALRRALEKEETLFVAPSLLLALGSVGQRGNGEQKSAALRAVKDYAPPPDAEEKHRIEIQDARAKALACLEEAPEEPPLIAFDRPRRVLMTPPKGFSQLLGEELESLGFPGQVSGEGVLVETRDAAGLMKARCSMELLLPLGRDIPCTAGAIASAAAGEIPGAYRVELKDYAGDRGEFIRSLTAALGGRNNPSHYISELRVCCRGDRADVFLRPTNIPDGRFDYRREAIPASMHPATAAAVVRYAAKAAGHDHPSVLDPFCGSGTLLIEREKLSPCRSLIGVDISGAAVSAARVNVRAAHSRAQLVHKDCLRFEPRESFDEIYANLPFGNRVGTHEDNQRLYAAFASRLPSLLRRGGTAALYTMEYQLLSRVMKKQPGVKLLSQTRTEAGGLAPWLMLFVREG